MKKFLVALTCAASATLASNSALANRDHILIVGSSTVFPFSKVVAERYALKTGNSAPKVEPLGTGGGFMEFCKGIGISTPDIANASRRIKESEFKTCQSNGVEDIIEVLMGYDGIVLGQSVKGEDMALSLRDVFLALAKKVPDPKGTEQLVDNPYKTWKDVNPELPAIAINVMGPPPTSGTRDAFVELAMEGGCQAFDWIAQLEKTDKSRYKAICHGLREDGRFIQAGENDNLIVRKLAEQPDSVGIFGFSFLDQNADTVRGLEVGGRKPTFESISDGSYVIARPLLFYAKKAHVGVIPGMEQFLAEFTSRRAMGEEGYLVDKGMIPLSPAKRKEVAKSVKNLESMSM